MAAADVLPMADSAFAAAPVAAAPAAPNAVRVTHSVWVGNLPNDVTNEALTQHFSAIAPIANLRVITDWSTKKPLGHAYVNFTSNEDAMRAIGALNNTLLGSKIIRVMPSQRDPSTRKSAVGNLCVKQLTKDVSARDLQEAFTTYGAVQSVKVATDEEGVSKGYGFVHFVNEEDSIKALALDGVELTPGMVIRVEKFVPRAMRQSNQRWNNLFVKNFPKSWTLDGLKSRFSKYGEILSAALPVDDAGVPFGFAFVCFKEHEAAVKAMEAENDSLLEEAAAGEEAKHLYVVRHQKKAERERAKAEAKERRRKENAATYEGMNLYVRNLDESVNDEKLRELFAPFGTIKSAKIPLEANGSHKGFGFVCFSSKEEAEKARAAMHHKTVGSKSLYVANWEARVQRDQRLAHEHAIKARTQQQGPVGFPVPQGVANMQQLQTAMMAMSNPAIFMQLLMFMQQANNPAFMAQVAQNPQLQQVGVMAAQLSNVMRAMNMQQAGAQGRPVANQRPQAAGAQGQRSAQRQGGTPSRAAQGPRPAGAGQARAANGRPASAQARGPTPAGVPVTAPQAAFNPAARNLPAEQMQQAMMQMASFAMAMPQAAPMPVVPVAPAPVAAREVPIAELPAQLAQADPASRKNLIGERLYNLIARSQPVLAGKITGMLLEGMEDTELLHLLETQPELDARIAEAISVLEQHKGGN